MASPTKATSFKFDERTTNLLDELKEKTHAGSRTEVIRKALALMQLGVDASKEGDALVIRSHDEKKNDREIVMY